MLGKRLASLTWAGVLVFCLFEHVAKSSSEDPPEVILGERLFRETRFAQFYQQKSSGNINEHLKEGDPSVEFLLTLTQFVPNPYRGKGMNCASCHLVDEVNENPFGGNRSYTDFARRSPIPQREQGAWVFTPRNSPTMVDASLPRRNGVLLHYDGEFSSSAGLVRGTLTGRNLGWLPSEAGTATAHIAKVVREDRGLNESGTLAEGSYAKLFLGSDPSIPEEVRLPETYRLDVFHATDEEILDRVSELVSAYMDSLSYARNENEEHVGSPYDRFLEVNGFPRKPEKDESPRQYAERLRMRIENEPHPKFVSESDRKFALHRQKFQFGVLEYEGLKTFLRKPDSNPRNSRNLNHVGNCVSCHTPPHFTDFSFHNVGVTQEEYDSIHGEGAFSRMFIPSYFERLHHEKEFLPASAQFPTASGRYREGANRNDPSRVDLGVWNILANPSVPSPQVSLQKQLCETWTLNGLGSCADEILLSRTIAAFKTPILRDLGHSSPYMHNGGKDTIEDVVRFYVNFSNRAKAGQIRNHDPELERMHLSMEDIPALAAFLRALNEDYE
jgi:cytochrome c peroxidase